MKNITRQIVVWLLFAFKKCLANPTISWEKFENSCKQPLGFENGNIKNSQFFASSTHVSKIYGKKWHPFNARLDLDTDYNAWMPEFDREIGSYLEINLEQEYYLTFIGTQGTQRYLRSHYVTTYRLEYSVDYVTWHRLKNFKANRDCFSPVFCNFHQLVKAKVVRLYPISWYRHPAVRMELFGCLVNSTKSTPRNPVKNDRFFKEKCLA